MPVPDRAALRPEAVLDWHGPISPPRRNGEIVFEELWESRVFGMTMTLFEAGAFRWEEFRDRLIEAIAAWERAHHPHDADYRYWDCWLAAFERLVAEKGLCSPRQLDERVAAFAARPAGHDHAHHDHDHGAHDHGAHDHDVHDHDVHDHAVHDHDQHDHHTHHTHDHGVHDRVGPRRDD